GRSYTITFLRNASPELFGCSIKLDILLDHDLSADKVTEQKKIADIISKTLILVDADKKLYLQLAGNQIDIKSVVNPDPSARFMGKVGKKLYSFNQLNDVETVTIIFANEKDIQLVHKPDVIKYKRDHCGNAEEINYGYRGYSSLSSSE